MRSVILAMRVSLDGFISGPDGELDWVTFDEEVDDYTLSALDEADMALLGRELYQGFLGYWPEKTSFFSKGEEQFARWINEVPKVVFSTTLNSVEWNAALVRENIAEEVAKLRQRPGKDMMLFGGVRIAQTFARLGLVDEYRLLVSPVALGKGKPLFESVEEKMRLKLAEARPFASGDLWLPYRSMERNA